jgi:hypothetical protein
LGEKDGRTLTNTRAIIAYRQIQRRTRLDDGPALLAEARLRFLTFLAAPSLFFSPQPSSSPRQRALETLCGAMATANAPAPAQTTAHSHDLKIFV